MNEQFSLPGFGPAKATDRLLFLVYADANVAPRMTGLARDLCDVYGVVGPRVLPEHLHVTLHHLGDYAGLPRNVVAKAREAAAAVAAAPFTTSFDRVISFRGKSSQPLVLCGSDGAAALTAFQPTLGTTMARAGLGSHVERRFTPHVTLAYADRGVPEHPVEPIVWTVREFVLVHTLLGQTRHVPLARWPLRG